MKEGSVPPLFSIITVTYNAADTVKATLESVASQSFDLYEHLVMDGGSTDGTVELASRWPNPRVKVMSGPDRGIYDAMNKGLAVAKGDYVIFLNAGDTFHASDTLSRIADLIMDNDYPGVVYGQTDLVDAQRRRVGSRHLTAPEELTYRSFADGMVVCHQAFVALRRLAPEYDLRWRLSADYEWCLRVLQHSRCNVMLPGVMIDYLNEGMTTRNLRRSLKERFKIMCLYFGTVPTVARHVKFALRGAVRRLRGARQ